MDWLLIGIGGGLLIAAGALVEWAGRTYGWPRWWDW
jgi:hypothetical protein